MTNILKTKENKILKIQIINKLTEGKFGLEKPKIDKFSSTNFDKLLNSAQKVKYGKKRL